MALETATFLDDLVTTNPVGTTDFVGGGGGAAGLDHVKLLKTVLQNTFPGVAFAIGMVSLAGTGTAYTMTLSPAPAALVDGMRVWGRANVASGASPTLDVNSLGAKTIKKLHDQDIAANDIEAQQIVEFIYNSNDDTWELVSGIAVGTAPELTTGDIKGTFKIVADTGWVFLDDGTIGNASSGGTTRANADTEDLFTLLWDNISDSFAAVSSGRGASAAADFAADKNIGLPKSLGRAHVGQGSGSGLTTRAMGETGGSEDAIVVTHLHAVGTFVNAAEASHTHAVGSFVTANQGTHAHTAGSYSASSAGAHTHPVTGFSTGISTTMQTRVGNATPTASLGTATSAGAHTHPITGSSQNTGNHTHTMSGTSAAGSSHNHTISGSSANTGSSGTNANMEPFMALNYLIKL